MARQRIGGQLRLRRQDRAAGGRQRHGIGGLVVVHGIGIRHQNGGAANRGEFRHRRGTGPADHQLRRGHASGHVAEEDRQLGIDPGALICRPHRPLLSGPHLLGHGEPLAQRLGQQGDRPRHQLGENARALAAAKDEQIDRAAARWRVGLIQHRQHGVAHRIAEMHQRSPGGRIGHRPGAAGDPVDAAREQPVDPAQHAVLLMDQPRQAQPPGRRQGRQRRIAAEACDTVGRIATELPDRLQNPRQDPERGHQLCLHPALSKSAGPEFDPLHRLGKAARIAQTAPVGGQLHPPVAPQHLLGQSLGRKHMPASAPRRDDQEG